MSNKISDKNVANIEDDVKILEEFAEICKAGLACYDQTREGEAIEHILAEREQDKQRIKELEEERKKYIVQLTDEQYRNLVDTIRKEVRQEFEQKVIDVIQEYKNKIEQYDEYRAQGKETDVEYYENITNTEIVQVLQELLGGKN